MRTPDLFLDARATLGEGPVWHPRLRQLLWVDIEQHLVHVTDPTTRTDRTIDLRERVGCIVPAAGSLAVVARQSGFAFVDLDTGAVSPIHDPEGHLPGNRFNDGKCDPAGRLWAGTLALDDTPEAGALYCLDERLHVTRKVEGVSVSNGLAWSLDERTMYFVDSPTREVVAYDYERSTGTIANRRVAYAF
jgi:sugar lactone lactonase YvrE